MIELLGLLFPGKCVNCGVPLNPSSQSPFCQYCHSRWEMEKQRARRENRGQPVYVHPNKKAPDGKESFLYISNYNTACTTTATNCLIYKLKYQATSKVCNFVAGELAALIRNNISILFDGSIASSDVIVTNIPRRHEAILKYGYDHMERVAKLTAAKLEFKYAKLLTKTGKAAEQKKLDSKGRLANAESTTMFNDKYNISGKTILLLDDIITTGASVSAGSALLKAAGARYVIAASIAATYHEL